MTYTIKCIAGIHSRNDFSIKAGQEKEVSKEIYDYFNNTFGSSGKFNFATKGEAKKAKPEEKAQPSIKKEEEVKVPKKRVTKKVETKED